MAIEKTKHKKQLNTHRMKHCRLKKKVLSLQNVVDDLQKKILISGEYAAILENTFAEVPKEIMSRIVKQKKKNPGAYTPELRSFALTLKF